MNSKQGSRYIKRRMGNELKNKILEYNGIITEETEWVQERLTPHPYSTYEDPPSIPDDPATNQVPISTAV